MNLVFSKATVRLIKVLCLLCISRWKQKGSKYKVVISRIPLIFPENVLIVLFVAKKKVSKLFVRMETRNRYHIARMYGIE